MPSRYPDWYWWIWSAMSITALILGILAVVDVNTIYDVRCFETSGVNLVPTPGGYTGTVNGCMEFGVNKLQVNLQWWMPLSHGIPSSIIIKGPLDNGGVGALPIANSALTICGANNTNTCAALESITCDEYALAPGCGRLEITITDLAPTDFPLTSQLPKIGGFLSQAKLSPQLFYVSVEHSGDETGRGTVLQLGRVN